MGIFKPNGATGKEKGLNQANPNSFGSDAEHKKYQADWHAQKASEEAERLKKKQPNK